MATNATAVGVQSTFWGIRDSAGYIMGTTGTIANGSAGGMGRLSRVTEFGIPTAPLSRVPVLGDNGVASTFLIPAQDVAEGQIVASVNDPAFVAAASGLPIVTADGYDWLLAGVDCISPKSVCFIQNSPAQNQSSGSVGNPGYLVRVVPNTTVQSRIETIQQAAAHSFPFDVVANAYDRFPWGTALVSVTHGSTRATHLAPFWSPYPLAMHTLVGDGAVTTVTLDEVPAAASGTAVLVYINGTKQTYTTHYTVNTGTRVVTFGTAPTAGQKVEILYQFVVSC